jgi:hypothetical protein
VYQVGALRLSWVGEGLVIGDPMQGDRRVSGALVERGALDRKANSRKVILEQTSIVCRLQAQPGRQGTSPDHLARDHGGKGPVIARPDRTLHEADPNLFKDEIRDGTWVLMDESGRD